MNPDEEGKKKKLSNANKQFFLQTCQESGKC
jgi:hypothetical protein